MENCNCERDYRAESGVGRREAVAQQLAPSPLPLIRHETAADHAAAAAAAAARHISPAEEAEQRRHQLDFNMENLNVHFLQFHNMKFELRQFEDAYDRCKHKIEAAAAELVRRIHEHEARMLDELATQRRTEYQRAGLGDDGTLVTQLENKLLNLQRLCGQLQCDDADDCAFVEQYERQRHELDALLLAATDVQVISHKVNELRHSVFHPVRCNTAFGTIDLSHKYKQPIAPNNRKASICCSSTTRHYGSQSSSELDSDYDDECASQTSAVSPPIAMASLRKFSLQPISTLGTGLSVSPQSLRQSPAASPQPTARRSLGGGGSSPTLSLSRDRCAKYSPIPSDSWSDSEALQQVWCVDNEGPQLGQINCPSDVTFMPDGVLVVSDRGNKRVQLFNQSGDAVKTIAENKIKPSRVHVNKHGHIVISDSKENNVCVYDKKGTCQSILGKKIFKSSALFKAPCGVASRAGKQYVVSDLERNDVRVYNSDGKLVKDLGRDSSECIEFKKPSYVTTDHDGRILVSDNLNHCVKVFDQQGKYLFQCVLGGNDRDKNIAGSSSETTRDVSYLKYPNGVCCDANNDIYVADWGSHTVSHFTRHGHFVRHVLTRDDGIYHPAGVAILGERLAICSYSDSHSSVQVFRLNNS